MKIDKLIGITGENRQLLLYTKLSLVHRSIRDSPYLISSKDTLVETDVV